MATKSLCAMSDNLPSRVWFLNQGCKQVPLDYTRGIVRWAHPDGYFLSAKGQKVAHELPPSQMIGGNPNTQGGNYPRLRSTKERLCHVLMALTFYGPRPDEAEIGVTKKRSSYVCHHLIPYRLNYRPANLLCWLTRAEHAEADRRQRALKKVVPDGNLRLFSYERLRELQDPRTMSRERFETVLAALAQQHFHRDNLDFDARMDRDMSHHVEH